MSLEDLNSDFLSDDSDYEAKENGAEAENDDDDEANYQELVHLHDNLMCFDDIYSNNIMIDMQCGGEAWSDSNSSGVGSVLALIQDYIDSVFEDTLSTNSSVSPSATSAEEGPTSSDTEDSSLRSVQDFVQLCEAFSDMGSDGQMSNEGDTNDLQDEVAEGPP